MADARLLDHGERAVGVAHSHGALELARRLPNLVVAAKDVAATAIHGVHGRRRAGVGETFWQFRPFVWGEPTARIDWRRSARDDRVYVREREWESAHTVWIWIDRSPSMAYVSSLAQHSKLDRALVLGLAAADLLVRGGERVGFPGLLRPLAARNIVDRAAQAMIQDALLWSEAEGGEELPPADALAPRAQALLIGDFLSAPEAIERAIHGMASRGALGHVAMIADPIEETFPFAGHMELRDVDSDARLRLGEASSVRDAYIDRLAAHRDRVRAICAARGWSFMIHRTDRPTSEALLALRMRLESAQTEGPR